MYERLSDNVANRIIDDTVDMKDVAEHVKWLAESANSPERLKNVL